VFRVQEGFVVEDRRRRHGRGGEGWGDRDGEDDGERGGDQEEEVCVRVG